MSTTMREPVTRTLWTEIERVYQTVARRIAHGKPHPDRQSGPFVDHFSLRGTDEQEPLERISHLFELSPFEQDLLILCAGASIDPRFAELVMAGGTQAPLGTQSSLPTYGMAAAYLDAPHWSALSRLRPLRHWTLIEVGAGPLLNAPLIIDERILQFLLGVATLDERLALLLHPLDGPEEDGDSEWTSEVRSAAREGVLYWRQTSRSHDPLVLTGSSTEERVDLFRALCAEAGLQAWVMDAIGLPASVEERERLARAFTREAALCPAALLVRTASLDDSRQLEAWLHRVEAPVAVEASSGSPAERLRGVKIAAPALTALTRKKAWQRHLGPLSPHLNDKLDALVEAFPLDAKSIRQVAEMLRHQGTSSLCNAPELQSAAWRLCRASAQRSLDELATRVTTRSTWNNLVLPEAETGILRQIVAHARNAARVHQDWGFADQLTRGLGLSVLFSGASGTGKTMAAGILARELDRDLYQIDLATVVSKYIGETEKHLRRIFEAAEQSGAILLFDEADALFGKRSQIRDSHDRYANLEVSYLLQRMETYQGIAILTTNMQNAMDTAFQRRLRFVVQFPFPDAASRERLWRKVFPPAAPTAALDPVKLAQLNVTGGVIRNIALLSAFLAANENTGIEMRHVLAAARTEYAKLDKPLSAAETRGWL